MSPHPKSEVGALVPEEISECPHCGKPEPLCICSDIAPIDNRIEVLILQHPQEQDRALGTARLTALHLQNAALKIGLSWPSLSKILGRSLTLSAGQFSISAPRRSQTSKRTTKWSRSIARGALRMASARS